MIIQHLAVAESGPGIVLSNQPERLSVRVSDPVTDLEYAWNVVTLTFD